RRFQLLSRNNSSFNKLLQVLAVAVLGQGRSQCQQLLAIDPPLTVGNLFRTANLKALTGLDGLNEIGRFQQRLMRTSIQPRKTTAQRFKLEGAFVQITLVEIGDFQLTTWRGLQFSRIAAGIAIVEVRSEERRVGKESTRRR